MASKKTLNAKNLEALGAARLSELLMEMSAGNAAAKRRLRFELAATLSSGEVANAVRKRLTTIARSRTFVDWHKRRSLIDDLDMQRRAIVDHVVKGDPAEALDLMWRFMALANPVLERCDDGSGAVIGVFHAANRDLGTIAAAAKIDPRKVADQAFRALNENDCGQYDNLIEVLTPALGSAGIEHLKRLFLRMSESSRQEPRGEDREATGRGLDGPVYADDYAERRRESIVRMALQEIADAQGDVDGFIAQQTEKAKTVPGVAARIAQRLLAAGRVNEAWTAINAIQENRSGLIPFEWEQLRIDVLEARGRSNEAQAFRWNCFEHSLNATHLRAYLKRLPGFDDVEAEERALSHALVYPSMHQALMFFVSWPALDRAAQLVLTRWEELDGGHYEILGPAADALEARHPLAATVLRRSMIDFSLDNARATRYRHAARHLLQCESLTREIADHGPFEAHEAYLGRLRAKHGRKTSFWSLLT